MFFRTASLRLAHDHERAGRAVRMSIRRSRHWSGARPAMISLLLDVPEHRRTGRDEARDGLARRRNETPFAEMDIGRPLHRPELRGLGDLLQLGGVGLA